MPKIEGGLGFGALNNVGIRLLLYYNILRHAFMGTLTWQKDRFSMRFNGGAHFFVTRHRIYNTNQNLV